MRNNTKIKQISDLWLAAALEASGFQILEIDFDGHQAIFSFEMDDYLEETIDQYWSDRLRLSPLAYKNVLKNLKTRIATS